MLLGPKVPLDVAPAGPMYESIIMCSTVRGARLTLWTVQVIDLEDFLAVAPCADLTIHSVARRKGRSCAVGSRCQSAVTSRVAQPLERAVDRGGEFAQASVASSSSADACATCSFSFSPRPFSLLPLTLFVRPGERCWGGKSDCVGMALCPCPSRAWGVLPPAPLGTPVRSRGHALDRSFVRWMPECVPLGGLPDSDDSREEHDSKTRRRDGMDRA